MRAVGVRLARRGSPARAAGPVASSAASTLVLKELWKVYPGGLVAVKDFNLEVADGELMVLLGPSGCGKSTILRMIAGLEDVTYGSIELGGTVLNNVAERERDIAMVFQSYALYPHMSVQENIAYPLKHRDMRREERQARIEAVARVLQLEEVLSKRPAQLSGGQRQRVAMGRAMVREPKLFLLDEPLSNLDAALRVQMRTEIHSLQRRLGVGMIFVTHDQVEAMTLGDRIAVMRDGVLQQIGQPQDVYRRPANVFVAKFMGSPGMTLFAAPVLNSEAGLAVRPGEYTIRVDEAELSSQEGIAKRVGTEVVVGVRPEDFSVADGEHDNRCLRGMLSFQEQLGSSVIGYFTVKGLTHGGDEIAAPIEWSSPDAQADHADQRDETPQLLPCRFPASVRLVEGSAVDLHIQPGGLRFFDPQTGEAI